MSNHFKNFKESRQQCREYMGLYNCVLWYIGFDGNNYFAYTPATKRYHICSNYDSRAVFVVNKNGTVKKLTEGRNK